MQNIRQLYDHKRKYSLIDVFLILPHLAHQLPSSRPGRLTSYAKVAIGGMGWGV